MANFLSTEGLTYTLQKLKLILDKKSSSDHTHNIESLNNYSKRIYDATTSRSATTFLAAPTGKDGVASFRKIIEADLPTELETHVIPYYKTFNAGGGDGSKLYLKIISIDLTGGQYLNHPMIFMFGHRGGNAMTRLTVQFTHSTTADSAAVNTFGIAGASMDFYIVKETAGKFAIYVKKSESYDNIALYGYYKGSYMANVKVTFTDTAVASVPAGSTTATWNESVGTAASVDWDGVKNHPTTISGYGITDAASKTHGHNYAGSTSDGGAAKSVASSIKIQLNGGTTEGDNQFTFNGSAAKTVNITPAKIGALPSGGTAVKADKATEAEKLSTSAGSGTQPIYFSSGKPTACSYTLEKSVPSTAKFTDTTYSTGDASTSGLTKLYTSTGTNTDGTMTQSAIKTALDGKANSSHTHSYAGSSSAGGAATKVANSIVIKLNGGTEEGKNKFTFDGSGTKTIDITPSAIGAGTSDSTYTHPNSGVTAGTYKSVTVNAQGHVTAGTNPTTLKGYGITDAVANSDVVSYNTKEGDINSMTGNAAWTKIPNLATLAYWNGRYNTTASNLAYCNQGAFGTIVTKNVGDYATASHTHSTYLPLAGGTMTGTIKKVADGGMFISARARSVIYNDGTIGEDAYYPVITSKSLSGTWSIGVYKNSLCIVYGSNTNYDANKNECTTITLDKDKNLDAIATKVKNALTVKYENGDTVATFDGSAAKEVKIPKIKTGTSLPDASGYKDGDIFILYS